MYSFFTSDAVFTRAKHHSQRINTEYFGLRRYCSFLCLQDLFTVTALKFFQQQLLTNFVLYVLERLHMYMCMDNSLRP